MAKSIYDILGSLETETSVPDHGSVHHTLPRNLLPTAEQFEDAKELRAWAEDKGVMQAALQKGIQKFIIDLRATFKATKKDEIWTQEKGQAAVDDARWSITNRPHTGGKEAVKRQAVIDANMAMAQAMKATDGITEEMLMTTLTASCGEELAAEIIGKM